MFNERTGEVSVQRIVMVYRGWNSGTTFAERRFRTTNCYGLSLKKIGYDLTKEDFRTTNCYGLSCAFKTCACCCITFPYNELLWFITIAQFEDAVEALFRTTNCYGLSFFD